MRHVPLLGGDVCAAHRPPPPQSKPSRCWPAARSPGRGRVDTVAQVFQNWWRLTTDRNYLASPSSRRVFWRFYPYIMFCFMALWLVCMWADLVDFDTGLVQAMAVNYLCSLVVSSLPITTICPDFLFSTAWSINLWVFSNHEQARSAAGWHQLPFFLFYAWAAGLHSCFVAQFCFIGCLAIFADPRFDINSQCTLMLLGVSVVATAVVLEWQSVSHFQKLQALLNVSTDGRIVVNRFTGTIVSMSQEASEVLGGRLIGKPFGCLAHDTDRPRVEDWFSRSHGEPSEAFMATLRCGQLPEAKPMQEFEARIIPFEIAGPHLHFCLQVVGEVRAYDVGASSAKESRESAGALTSTYALVTGTPHFAWTRTTSRSTPNYSMSSAASRRDDDECSFAISSSIGQVRPRSLECFGLLSEQDDNACALTVSSQSDAIPTTLGRRLPAAPYLAEAGVQTSPLAEDLGLPSLAEAIADALQRHGGRAGAPQRSACCPWHGATEEAALAVEMLRRTACDKYWAASGGIGPPVADADVPPRAREGASEDSREGFGAPPAARLRAPCQASRWGEAPADAAAAGTALESPSVSSPAVRHLLSL